MVLSLSLWAQGQGKISGRVASASGQPVANAVVNLVNNNDGSSRRVLTAADGTFTVMNLVPGTYRVEVESAGYKRATQNEMVIATAPIDVVVKLEAGAVTETVEIKANAPVIQPDSAEVSREYDAKFVQELPVLDRNYHEFIGLMPGVTPPMFESDPRLDPQRNRMWNTNGQPEGANYKTLEGVANQEAFTGREVHIAPVDAIRHLDVRTSNYTADGGRAAGSIHDVNTRPGTNGVHGSVYEFYSPGLFQARSYFNREPNSVTHLVSNQFGASIGGPIARDTMFFFLNYEGNRIRQSMTNVSTVPTAEFRAGNFSGLEGISIFNPRSGTANGSLRTPFGNNTIPNSSINPLSAALLQTLPLPNQGGLANNYVTNVPVRTSGSRPSARLDWRLEDDTYAYARYGISYFRGESSSPLGFLGNSTDSRLRNHSAMADIVHNFSSNTTADLRLGYSRYSNALNPMGFTNSDLPSIITNAFPNGLPNIQIGGMEAFGSAANVPSRNYDNNWNLVNLWGMQKGRHSVKMGFDAWWIRMDGWQNSAFGPRGAFSFTPGPTLGSGINSLGPAGTFANSFASFLTGSPSSFGQQSFDVRPSYTNWQIAGFASDRVQFGRKLTLDLGLRYEFFTPLMLRQGNGFFTYNAMNNQFGPAGSGNSTSNVESYTDWNYNNWAPRFSLAYRATNKTVVRTGYSISYWNPPAQMDAGLFVPGNNGFQMGTANGFLSAGAFGAFPRNTGTASVPNLNFVTAPARLKSPSVQSYNFLIQQEMGWGTVIDLGYVGNLGRHLPFMRELNAAQPGTGLAGLPFNNAAFGFRTASTLERDNGLNSNYNSAQVNLTKRFAQMFSFSLAYTWSKSLDYGNPNQPMLNSFDRGANYGPSDWDRTHMFTLSHLIQLPFGAGGKFINRGIASQILGQWQLSGVLRLASGAPFTVTADPTLCNCPGLTPTANVVVAGSQTVLAPSYFYGYLYGFVPYEVPLFAFTEPGAGQIGNAGRNSVRGPRLTNYNLSVFRNFPVHDRAKLEIRGEAYNLTNTPNFDRPNGNINSLMFGQSNSLAPSYGPRTLQFAARVVF